MNEIGLGHIPTAFTYPVFNSGYPVLEKRNVPNFASKWKRPNFPSRLSAQPNKIRYPPTHPSTVHTVQTHQSPSRAAIATPFSSSLLARSAEPSSPPSSSQPRRRRAARSPCRCRAARSPRHRRAARCPWRLPTTKTKSPTSPTGKTPPSAGPCACGFLVFGRVPVCTLCLSIWPAVCAPVLNCWLLWMHFVFFDNPSLNFYSAICTAYFIIWFCD